MPNKKIFTPEQLRYLQLLSTRYPTVQAASAEIIRLQSILNLPKGTEHFISDIHGESDAFLHILNCCSGEIKEKLKDIFGDTLTRQEHNDLATLIYYPKSKLRLVADTVDDMNAWYRITIHRLIQFCRFVSIKHTRNKVRSLMPDGYQWILDELIHVRDEDGSKRYYFENLINSIISIGQADDVIRACCSLIKALCVDSLHIVGDIFDRGPRADIVMDHLMQYHNVDIQWGNHDILWMGAASGSRTMVAAVLANSILYNNLDVLEIGYGISLRPLSIFANEVYRNCDTSCFSVRLTGDNAGQYTEKDKLLSARMYKAITMILFKLEGNKILQRPEYGMTDRALLHRINYKRKTIIIDGIEHPLLDCDFPTVDPENPYRLTEEESQVIDRLTEAFRYSEKLQAHTRFLYSKGSLYKAINGNLLFHGCIPMTGDGQLQSFTISGSPLSGKAFMDYADKTARRAYYHKQGTPERKFGMDFLWWLWAGRNSPLFGRDRMTTFERRFIADEATWAESKNAYYTHCHNPQTCEMLLKEFGLEGEHCHIINGHVPVRVKKGESPLKAGGRLIVIDGGFSKAYQPTSGIAGYTLIFGSRYMRIVAHQPFAGKKNAVHSNADIDNDSTIFERLSPRMKVADTNEGDILQAQANELMDLLDAYRAGIIAENHSE